MAGRLYRGRRRSVPTLASSRILIISDTDCLVFAGIMQDILARPDRLGTVRQAMEAAYD